MFGLWNGLVQIRIRYSLWTAGRVELLENPSLRYGTTLPRYPEQLRTAQ